MKNLLSVLFTVLSISALFAQDEEVTSHQFYYHIIIESPETGEISREKIKGQEAVNFNVATFLEQHDPESRIRIIGKKTTDKEYISFSFDSKKMKENADCSKFCQKIESVERIPFLGVAVNPMDDFSGVEVDRIFEESPLAETAMEAGAVITSLEVSEISNPCDLIASVSEQEVDGLVDVNYNQDGESFLETVKLSYRVKKKVTWELCCEEEETFQASISKNRMALNVFPNPTTDFTHVEFQTTNFSETQMLLTDLSGRIISERKITPANGVWSEYFDFSNYGPGVYILHLEQGEEVVTERIVVMKK